MPRLRSKSGVVVNVDDDTAARLGNEWQPVEAAETKPADKRATTTKK